MDQASGNPSGFTVLLYDLNGRLPGRNVGTRTGANPVTPGVFTFASPDIVLSSLTSYFIVATGAGPVAQGSYQWSTAASSAFFYSDGWIRGAGHYYSPNGSSWTVSRESSFQFAVNATAVPELSSMVLICFSGLILGVYLFRHAKVKT